jgi:bacteriorhodopsin
VSILLSSGLPTPCKLFANSLTITLLITPSVWGLADGARKIGVDGEVVSYAVLDVLAKGVFGAWLLVTHAKLRESDVELNGFWSNGLNSEGAVRLGEDDGA